MMYAVDSGRCGTVGHGAAGAVRIASSSPRPAQGTPSATGSRSSSASTAFGRSLPNSPRSRGSGWAASRGT